MSSALVGKDVRKNNGKRVLVSTVNLCARLSNSLRFVCLTLDQSEPFSPNTDKMLVKKKFIFDHNRIFY